MNEPTSPICPRCGAPLPAGATDRSCPACLMSAAINAPGDETVSMASAGLPAPGRPMKFPRDLGGYRLLGLLGAGGMGTVYEAEQVATGRRVALKMLGQRLDSPEMRRRFLREGRLAASVNHPNSLYIFGSEEIETAPVITMEIAGGGTLKDRLKKRGPFPVKEAVDAILDVVSGLEAAHAGGVLHRDIKPSNCFVGPEGSVKVGDFGLSVSTLAKEDSYITASGVIMGTPAYASPEQLRGDSLDVRADIYSVGATLFTLITGRPPFEGDNAVQVVANVMNRKPTPMSERREEVPHGLDRVVTRCLAKVPEGRFAGYRELREALLPFSSREPEPASMRLRAPAGWIDYLLAFLVPYVPLMLLLGNDQFHLRMFMDRTLYSAWHYMVFFGFGSLYFGIAEGIWGAGFGKRFKGVQVVRAGGRPPGIVRALVRILIPICSIEVVRIPLLMATISARRIDDMTTPDIVIFSVATTVCPMIPVLLGLTARRRNGYATLWDLLSGTRVVVRPKATVRPAVEPVAEPVTPVEEETSLGPYRIDGELVPGEWMVATDPVLRRRVWLLQRSSGEPSAARRNLGRAGRLRWLQKVESAKATWDAFEATRGIPFTRMVGEGRRLPWGTLRHWLHDLASEIWAATGDETLPADLGLDQVWITEQGRAVLLDRPWPVDGNPSERIAVGDVAGQQRFLNAVAACAEPTSLPLHARPVLRNLENGKFEKLSFLTGTLRGILDRPADVSPGIRAGAIFMIPLYAGIMIFVGAYPGAEWLHDVVGHSATSMAMATILFVLLCCALLQLLSIPFRNTGGHSLFRMVLIDGEGIPATRSRLLARWAIVWLPLVVPLSLVALTIGAAGPVAYALALVLLTPWIAVAIHAVFRPNRGLHDRLAGTWVVRR